MMGTRVADRDDRQESGYSLIELLVVIMILGVVGGITLSAIVLGFTTQRHQTDHVNALNDGKQAIERITRDVRMADPVLAARSDVLEINVSTASGDVPRTYIVETVAGSRRLSVCHTNLAGCSGAAKSVVVDGLNPDSAYAVFTFKDQAGAPISGTSLLTAQQLRDLRSVGIDLRLMRPEGRLDVVLATNIELRNAS